MLERTHITVSSRVVRVRLETVRGSWSWQDECLERASDRWCALPKSRDRTVGRKAHSKDS